MWRKGKKRNDTKSTSFFPMVQPGLEESKDCEDAAAGKMSMQWESID